MMVPTTELRITVTAEGVQKVDAPLTTKAERKRVFELYGRVLGAIQRLDEEIRTSAADVS